MPADKRSIGTVYDLDELLPKDIGFKFAGTTYRIPGDLEIDRTFELFELFATMITAQAAAEAGRGKSKSNADRAGDAIRALETYVLDLFKIRQPQLEQLPFGISGLMHVVRAILLELGAISPALEDGEAPERPLAPSRPKRPAAKKPVSRSRSSRSSRS